VVVWKASSSDDNDNHSSSSSSSSSLSSKRIQELREKEEREQAQFSNGLSNRVKEVANSQELQRLLESTTKTNTQLQLELPVVSFDALLPGQYLEGRTEDPTFLSFLGTLGLGGWFVMTSTSPKARKQRRHGVLAKIQAVDYDNTNSRTRTRIPTAVDFEIVGHSRCRIVGPRQNMQQRIGRWRRGYDPNCEESMLGWGMERFLDAPDELKLKWKEDEEESTTLVQQQQQQQTALACSSTEWSSVLVDVRLEDDSSNPTDDKDVDDDYDDSSSRLDKQRMKDSLIPMVDEWYQLASNADTYNNVNVTASTRIRKGHPGLWVDPKALLNRVLNQLGPRPDINDNDPTAFLFWAAALINPLPPLGVSLEIRGQMLEAPTIQRRMDLLEMGLRRSIHNLRGTRPL
jgi:hypothetical protein